jgi:CRP-like cAMP-binding protein
MSFKKGDTLIRQGDVGDSLYIIYDGNCGVYLNKENSRGEIKRSKQAVTTLTDGAVVGEQALNDRQTTMYRSAHIIAHSEEVVALVLTKVDYIDIIQVSTFSQI